MFPSNGSRGRQHQVLGLHSDLHEALSTDKVRTCFCYPSCLQKYLDRRTGKLFERNKERSVTGPAPSELGDDPYAVTNIAFSADTRVLAVTGSTGQVERRITAIFVSAKTATKVWWKFNDSRCVL